MADIVIANPPYLTRGRSQTSPDSSRAIAHSLGESGIESWCRAAAALLPPDGRFVMIHRADFLAEILPVFGGRFGAVEIIPVYPREGERAHRIIMRGIKGSRAPLAILPPVFLHKADGSFTPRAAALHRGDEVIA
jgi:tRNA1(Val) A37 N6-methylase TrmN6